MDHGKPRKPPAGWTCGWPGCQRRVGDNRAFCQAHYLLIPVSDRGRSIKAAFAAREGERQ